MESRPRARSIYFPVLIKERSNQEAVISSMSYTEALHLLCHLTSSELNSSRRKATE
ncbi:hypothetical protein PROFUN_02756 [Planoprotostelium fungivorum]|uniref:Uncharacterized protein n=1 Tax=Planoprotostelium fungivorum TaxID=1890364 RepID=A0A2P6NXG9_9EUKA|nr:hypothetical protein PROFUN_02756 [Planoprotostelium fungivorum]